MRNAKCGSLPVTTEPKTFEAFDLKESRIDEDAKRDLVGEIANTLSGNAREEFGSEFQISVPTVVVGAGPHLSQRNGSRNYAIPLNWHSETAYLLVALE